LKDSITSQTQLSWWGKHQRCMTNDKHVSHDQWKFDYNIKYSPLWIIVPYCGKGAGYGKVNMTCCLCEIDMGIHKHYECNTSLWNFAQQIVQGQHYVKFFNKYTK
jgi:hypothetical protein